MQLGWLLRWYQMGFEFCVVTQILAAVLSLGTLFAFSCLLYGVIQHKSNSKACLLFGVLQHKSDSKLVIL